MRAPNSWSAPSDLITSDLARQTQPEDVLNNSRTHSRSSLLRRWLLVPSHEDEDPRQWEGTAGSPVRASWCSLLCLAGHAVRKQPNFETVVKSRRPRQELGLVSSGCQRVVHQPSAGKRCPRLGRGLVSENRPRGHHSFPYFGSSRRSLKTERSLAPSDSLRWSRWLVARASMRGQVSAGEVSE